MPGNIWQLLFKNSGQQSPPILLMAEILHQLVGSLSHYLKGFIHCRWCRIPFINSITQQIYSEYSGQNPMKIWKFSLVLREVMPAYWHHLHHPRSQTAPKNHSLVSIVGVSCSSCCNNWCNAFCIILLWNRFGAISIHFHVFIIVSFQPFLSASCFSHPNTSGCCSFLVQVVNFPLQPRVQHVVLDEASVEKARTHKKTIHEKNVQVLKVVDLMLIFDLETSNVALVQRSEKLTRRLQLLLHFAA